MLDNFVGRSLYGYDVSCYLIVLSSIQLLLAMHLYAS